MLPGNSDITLLCDHNNLNAVNIFVPEGHVELSYEQLELVVVA